MILSLIFSLVLAPPVITQIQPDVRMNSGAWISGDGFTGATARYDRTITVTPENIKSEIIAALDGATIDWSKQGTDLRFETYTNQVAFCNPVLDCTGAKLADCGAYCIPFVLKNADGYSRTYRINEPEIFSLPGQDPKKLTPSSIIPIIGRHLSPTYRKPSVWLLTSDRGLINIPTLHPGGRGTGNIVDIDRSVLWVCIPSDVKPGDYQLFVFHGESRWGISNLIPVTVVSPVSQSLVSVQVSSGTDVASLLSSAKPGSNISLPPGKMILSKTIDVGVNTTIQGSSKTSTVLAGSLSFQPDPSKLVFDRPPMIRLSGSGITFRDLTIELTPDTARSAIAASAGTDSITFDSCRFISTTPNETPEGGYCDGFFYRVGLQKYWRFINCEFCCQQAFESRNDSLSGFTRTGGLDYSLIHNCKFSSIHGLSTGSLLGACVGRGTLIYGLDCSCTRRGFALKSGDGTFQSVIANSHFHDMLSETTNGEPFVHEARNSSVSWVNQADANSFTPFGPSGSDTQDRTRWTAIIISGRGFGQYRNIASSANGTHTIEEPWEVIPDKSSCVLISQCPTDCSLVWNRFDSTVGGINFYGNAIGCSVNSNWLNSTHEGILLDTNWNSSKTSGINGQSGDGRQVSFWHSFRSNTFTDGAGFHFVAPRDTLDLSLYRNPQIAFISTLDNKSFGDVVHQLWAAEGTEQNGNPSSAKLPSLIDYVASSFDIAYSSKARYLHPVIDRRPSRPQWLRTVSGIGTIRVGGYKYDDIPVPPEKSIQVAP